MDYIAETLWTKERVITRMREISEKGFLPIPQGMYRKDDGIVGQVLEREFGVEENTLHLADLGTYELKGMRRNSSRRAAKLTLFHQKPTAGLTTMEIFDRFCYEKPARNGEEMKRKLFTTVKGNRINNLGLILRANPSHTIDLYYYDEYLSTWDLLNGRDKINQILLGLAQTRGAVNSKNEQFHYNHAYILSEPRNFCQAIAAGAVVLEFCIDQPADRSTIPHDRGPHIRIPLAKLNALFGSVEKLF